MVDSTLRYRSIRFAWNAYVFFCALLARNVCDALSYPNCNVDADCKRMEDLVFLDKYGNVDRPNGLPPPECGINKMCLNPYRNGCLRTIDKIKSLLEGTRCFDDDSVESTLNNSIYHDREITFFLFDWMTDLQQVFIAQIFTEEILFQPTKVLVNEKYYQGFRSTELPKEALYRTQKTTQNEIYAGVKQTVAKKNNEMCKQSCPEVLGHCNEPCGHIVMEMWPNHEEIIDAVAGDTLFLTSKPSGLLGHTQMFVPQSFVHRYPEYRHISAYTDRAFLAKTFKRPVTWEEFCNHYAASFPNRGKCPPPDSGHKQRYFFDDSDDILNASFHGLFVIDPENNCTANPSTCAGNIVSPNKCHFGNSWELFQFNNMSEPDRMKRMGKNTLFRPEGSYSTDEMFQIWDAAQFNNEAVLMYWWYPDISLFKYLSSPYELRKVEFDAYSKECAQLHKNILEGFGAFGDFASCASAMSNESYLCEESYPKRCWSEKTVNRQKYFRNISMTCGTDASILSNVVSLALERMCANLHGNISDTRTLPFSVCRFLQRYRVSNRNLREIFETYIKQISFRSDFNDLEPLALRHSACRFFDLQGTDVFESFLKSVPKDFRCPRPVSASKRLEILSVMQYLLIALSILMAVASLFMVAYILCNPRKKTVRRNHPRYALTSLHGSVLIYGYIIINLLEPSDSTEGLLHCASKLILFYLGMIVFIIPIWVRISAINAIFAQSGRKMSKKHCKNEKQKMARYLALSVTGVIFYLIIWISFDPPLPTKLYSRRSNSSGTYEISQHYVCHTRSLVKQESNAQSYLWFPRIIDGSLLYLMLYGISIAQTNSLVEMKQYNDGLALGFSIWNALLSQILPALAYVKVIAFSEGDIMEKFVSCAALWWSITFFLVAYFQPKLVEALHEKLVALRRKSTSGSMLGKGVSFKKRLQRSVSNIEDRPLPIMKTKTIKKEIPLTAAKVTASV